MKIIVTGASGLIGHALVPRLANKGWALLLVGRDPQKLRTIYPEFSHCSYDDMAIAGLGYDVCIHLAVMNNNNHWDIELFRAANVSLLQTVFQNAKQAGCKKLINLNSFHAADLAYDDPYALSKREAHRWLTEQRDLNTTTLCLPAVYSPESQGNLAHVNMLPKLARPFALQLLGAVKPIVRIENVATAIIAAVESDIVIDQYVVEPASNNVFFVLAKKIVDLSFALTILILFWWLLLVVTILVRVTSNGPAIFAQQRIGKNAKTFTCYKFRTMQSGTRQVATHDLGSDVITPVGAFLRRTKIDELPQIFNILLGQLSLVGPRPCLPIQQALISERMNRRVLDVLPGITGWAQINDVDMSNPVKLAEIDAYYVARRTIPFELRIILRTFIGAGRGDRIKTNI